MPHTSQVVLLLRILLALVFAALLAAQVWAVPGVLPDVADPSLEQSAMRWTMAAVSIAGLLCVQVVIVCTWQLLTLVEDDRIFSAASMAWVDAIVGALAAAWFLLLGTFVWSVVGVGLPGPPVVLLLMLVAVAVLGLLMVVMRALLRQATTLRTDMEAVI
jgi:hypothetical protein